MRGSADSACDSRGSGGSGAAIATRLLVVSRAAFELGSMLFSALCCGHKAQPSKPNSPFAVWGHAGKGNGARTSDLLHHRLCSLRTRRRSSALRPLMSRSMSNSASMRLTASSAIGEIAAAFPPAPCVSGDRRLRDLKSADFESLRPVSTGGRIPTEWVAGLRRNGSRASLGIRNQARRYPALTIPCHSCILPVG
jgi:hypothetical protein